MNFETQKSSNRQVFNVEQPSQNPSDSDFITVDKPHVALTIWNLLITGVCVGLFLYVNSYFTFKLGNIITGKTITESTATFSCDHYFCDQTLYNYMYYYSYYQQCNKQVCTDVICTTYTTTECNNTPYWPDVNRYFACRPGCPNYLNSDFPGIMNTAYGIGIGAGICFGLMLLLSILAGIFFNIKAKQLSGLERIGLLVWFFWPALKYYAFRKRKYWGDLDLNLRAVVVIDYLCAILLSITTAIYIWFYVVGTWFQNKEVSLFFILLGTYISYWLLCWGNGRAFWKARQRFA